MIRKIKQKTCKNNKCGKLFPPKFSLLEKFCSSKCYYSEMKNKGNLPKKPKKRINYLSEKRKKESKAYTVKRLRFLSQPENFTCFIDGCNNRANTIEHIKGRIGFADDFARENNISLYLDERFWRPCCISCNLDLENNSELSRKHQLSKLHVGKKL